MWENLEYVAGLPSGFSFCRVFHFRRRVVPRPFKPTSRKKLHKLQVIKLEKNAVEVGHGV